MGVNLTAVLLNSVLITFAELAIIKGCTKAAVTHASKSRIAAAVVEQDGKRWLDRDLALELWNKNTLRNKQAKVSEPDLIDEPPRDAVELKRRVDALPDDSIPDLNESRAGVSISGRAANCSGRQRWNLVPVEEVRRRACVRAKRRKRWLQPDVGNQLAGETDPARIQVLTEEHRACLTNLANG